MRNAIPILRISGPLLVLLAHVGSARAEYRVQAGDALEVSVAGLPDLKHRTVVDVDGDASIPLIPPIKVGGLTFGEVQDRVRDKLSRKLYQQRTPDGRESVVAIAPDAVTVAIAEYRPIYMNGDVTKPGQQSYRPGLTVRQAVALAGGYEIMRFRMNNPFLESADLRADYQTLWLSLAKQQAMIWRIEAQLHPETPTDAKALETATQVPLPKSVLSELRSNTQQQLDLAIGQQKAERSYLQQAVQTSDSQVAMLRARQARDDENVQVDTAEYEKLKDFAARGNLPSTRLSESRRLFLFSATQSLQTGVQLTNTIRERDEQKRKIARLDETLKSDLARKLQDAIVERNAARSKLQAVGEKITYTGMIRSQLTRGGGGPAIRIIHPAVDGGGSEQAAEETPLRPGDTVEVALHTETPETTQ